MNPPPRCERSRLALAAALVLYVGLRLAILHTNFDAVAMPSYELGTIGNLAQVLVEGRGGAPQSTHFDNVGGHLVVAWLAAPCYACFGPSYLTLKLVPLLLGALTLLLIWRLLVRHFDRTAAVLAVFFFALAPPTLTKYSVIAKGNHFENLFFQLLFLNALFDLLTAEKRRRAALWAGLTAGLAVFVYTGALLVVVPAAIVYVLLRGWHATLAELRWTLAGFALGVAPLVVLDLASGGREREFLWTHFVQNGVFDPRQAWGRCVAFWTEILPHSPCFEDAGRVSGSLGEGPFLIAWALACGTLALAAWRARSRSSGPEPARRAALGALPWLVHLPAMSLLAAVFDFDFKPYGHPMEVGQYRYLVPHFAFAAILFGLAGARWLGSEQRSLRWAGAAFALLIAGLGVFTLPLVRSDQPENGLGARYEGAWFEYYPNVLLRDQPWDVRRIEAQVADFRPCYRQRTCQGVGFYMAWRDDTGFEDQGPAAQLDPRAITARFAAENRLDVAHGIGSYLRRLAIEGQPGRERLQRLLADEEARGDALLPYVVEGLALDLKYPLRINARTFLERGTTFAPSVPPALLGAHQRGLGIACGRSLPRGLVLDREHAEEYAARAPEQLRAEFFFGLGWGAAESTSLGDPVLALRAFVPAEQRAAAWQGYGAALRHAYGQGAAQHQGPVLEDERPAIAQGLAWPDYPRAYVLAGGSR